MKRLLAILSTALLLAGLSACGDETAEDTTGGENTRDVEAAYDPLVDPAGFVTAIDNPYLPFRAGTSWVYEGETDEGVERIEVTVTDETRIVMGVTCTIVWDRVWVDGELVEDTRDWYAQDREGNVWYFGEDSQEIEAGQVVSSAGSWEAGVDGAKPGIVLHADPKTAETYRQEYYPGEAEDMAVVLSLAADVRIGLGDYTGCIQTEEWTPLEPGIREHKFYARGIGVILEETVAGGEGRIELIEFRTT
ncbi:MAG: hypothetical protein ACYC5A_09885 [Thermoleophilia bacterium]